MIERRRPADHKRRAHSARLRVLRRLDYERVEAERGFGRPWRRLSVRAVRSILRPAAGVLHTGPSHPGEASHQMARGAKRRVQLSWLAAWQIGSRSSGSA